MAKIPTADILQPREMFRGIQVYTILWEQTLNRFIDQLDWIPELKALGCRFNSPRSLYFAAVQKREERKRGKGRMERKGKGFFPFARDRAAVQVHTILRDQTLNSCIDQLDWIPSLKALGPRFNSPRSSYFAALLRTIRGKNGGIRTFCRFMFPYFFPYFVRISIEKCQNTAFLISQRLITRVPGFWYSALASLAILFRF